MTFNRECQAVLDHQWFQAPGCFMDILHHIALRYQQLQFASLRLARLQNLLEQSYHALDIQLHHVILVVMTWLLLTQLIH